MTEGFHIVAYDDGDKYRGHWNGEGRRHGLGVVGKVVIFALSLEASEPTSFLSTSARLLHLFFFC